MRFLASGQSGLINAGFAAAGADAAIARIATGKRRRMTFSFPASCNANGLDGEALAAAAGALGVGVVEGEAGGEVVFLPVHPAADQVEDRGAIHVEGAAGRLDLLGECIFE